MYAASIWVKLNQIILKNVGKIAFGDRVEPCMGKSDDILAQMMSPNKMIVCGLRKSSMDFFFF